MLTCFIHTCAMLSHFSHVQLCATLSTTACQAPVSMGFSRQESWRMLPCLPLGDLTNAGTEPTSLMSPQRAGSFFPTSTTTQITFLNLMLLTNINRPDFRLLLHSYTDKNSMVLAQKQKYRSMEQYRKSRNKPTYL